MASTSGNDPFGNYRSPFSAPQTSNYSGVPRQSGYSQSPTINTRPSPSPINSRQSPGYSAPGSSNNALYAPRVPAYGTYQQQTPKTFATDAKSDIRMGFVRKVYGILSAQLLLTVLIAAPFSLLSPAWIAGNMWALYVSIIVWIVCMCAMACCAEKLRNYPTNYIFLFILTVVMAVMIGFISAMYTWKSVLLCAGVAMLLFLLLSCYAWLSKTDFTGLGPYFFAAVCAFLVFGIVLCILSLCGIYIRWLTILYDIIGLLLFSFFIIFDTQRMLGDHNGHKLSFSIDDYAFAALHLYLDIINVFLFLLDLFGKRR